MPGDDGRLRITASLAIPRSELTFRASRSSGPGGQHVNRSATRVELWWNVAESRSLSDPQRGLLLHRLRRRLDRSGRLRLVSDEQRSQTRNRVAAAERLVKLLAAALHVAPPRKATRRTVGSVEQRLEAKRRRAAAKARRRPVRDED
jgi:ribosome-associated protein